MLKSPGLVLIKLFILIKFILLINVKMPTIVGILTFISSKNTTSGNFIARTISISQHFNFYEQLKFHTLGQVSGYFKFNQVHCDKLVASMENYDK